MFEEALKSIHFISYKQKYIVFYYRINEILVVNEATKIIIEMLFLQSREIENIANELSIDLESVKELKNKIYSFVELKTNEVIKKEKNYKSKKSVRATLEYKVNVSHKCNLACKYCYADYNEENILMSNDVANNCVEYIVSNSSNSNILVSFFGGEPLLNVEVIETICEKISKHQNNNKNKYYFAVITNLTILNKRILDLFKKYSFSVRVSIDGPKEIHDKLRAFHNGKGSFEIVSKNLSKLIKEIGIENVGYEATYTNVHEESKCSRKELRKYLESNYGFLQSMVVDVLHPKKYRPNSKYDTGLFEKDFKLIDDGLKFFLTKYIKKEKMYYVCGMGKSYFVISANGDIYPCQKFVNSEFNIGNVSKPTNIKKYIDQVNLLEKSKNSRCTSCWAKDLCSDCPAFLMETKGNIIYDDKRCGILKDSLEKHIIDIYELKNDRMKYNNFIKLLDKEIGKL